MQAAASAPARYRKQLERVDGGQLPAARRPDRLRLSGSGQGRIQETVKIGSNKEAACRRLPACCLFYVQNLLHPVSGQNQADDHLPEGLLVCAVIPAVRDLMEGNDPVSVVQPCLKPAICFFGHTVVNPPQRSWPQALSDSTRLSGRRCTPDRSALPLPRRPGIWRGRRRNSCRRPAPSIPAGCRWRC